MPTIQIPFDRSLANVTLARGPLPPATPNLPAGTSPNGAASAATEPTTVAEAESAARDEAAAAALKTLHSIEQKLKLLDARLDEELSTIGVQLTAAATQIAKQALGSDNALVEERVAHFANLLLRQVHPSQSAVIYVHPDYVVSLQSWLSQIDYEAIEIQGDATVQPGDCRIESNGKGFLASLDSFLDAAGKQLSPAWGET
ncbi:flagellar assembly protein H [Stieleria maiorica]|uniref:Flagellar assembly protein FliH n=1 Tax=Stieleria maiorica TaxID=2795974 RepID=A0A5B9M8X7_9BACT|nr:FliH/SctL family protein [Stieleria maiorica]QEF97632.1 flagellar assembly protein H [Stieleria maiorica]